MAHDRSLLPVLAVTAGIALFSVMDGFMKSASLEGGVYNALLLRCAIGTAIVAPIWLAVVRRIPSANVLRLHGLRAVVVAGMGLLFFWGLARLPMAEAMALSFIAPLIALYLAAVVLGEQIHARAIVAALFGFAGVLVIASAHVGTNETSRGSLPGILAVLASAVLYAVNLILQRRQALVAGPVEVALAQHFLVGLCLLPAAPFLAAWPTPALLRDSAAAAALTACSLMLLSWAYARAETQRLVPLEYTGFIWAALFGWYWFDEKVTGVTLAGTALIVVGCWLGARKPERSPPPLDLKA